MNTYLKELSLAGFRSYGPDLKQNCIQLNGLNIIIGANGAGKSNLISFLEMISFMMTSSLRNYVAKQGGAQSLLYFGSQTDQIKGELSIYDDSTGKNDQYSFALEPSATNQLFFAKEEMLYLDNWHITPYHKDFGVGMTESGIPEATEPTIRTLKRYLEQLKVFHFNDTTISSRIRNGGNASDNGYLRSDGGNIAAYLYRMKENEASYPYYQRIIRHIRMVMPQFSEFYLEPDIGDGISLRWKAIGSDEVFGAHQLSDGTLRFIALTTLLMQPSDNAPMTIILDEPEIGLHPYAVTVLAEEMRMAAKTSQLIISTQSPMLLNQFDCEDIITADYDPVFKRSILRRHSRKELNAWLDDYSLGELWEKNVLGGLPV